MAARKALTAFEKKVAGFTEKYSRFSISQNTSDLKQTQTNWCWNYSRGSKRGNRPSERSPRRIAIATRTSSACIYWNPSALYSFRSGFSKGHSRETGQHAFWWMENADQPCKRSSSENWYPHSRRTNEFFGPSGYHLASALPHQPSRWRSKSAVYHPSFPRSFLHQQYLSRTHHLTRSNTDLPPGRPDFLRPSDSIEKALHDTNEGSARQTKGPHAKHHRTEH